MVDEIQRWTSPGEHANAEGEFVLYTDHAAEVARLRAVIYEAHETIAHEWGVKRGDTMTWPGDPGFVGCTCEHCIAHRAEITTT